MKEITSIKKRGENEVVLYLDENEKIIISLETFIKSGLRKNDLIPDDRFSFLLSENQIYNCKNDAIRFLSRRPHSKIELKIKLIRKKHAPNVIKEVLDTLESSDLINDVLFTQLFIEEKIRTKKFGLIKIKSELMKRGIERNIIENSLNNSESEKLNSNAMILLNKKREMLIKRGVKEDKLKLKLFTFLISKGYDYETVKNLINKELEDLDN